MEKHTLVKIIQEIAKTPGIRLTKAKLAQTLPIAGAAVGGGYNVYFTTQVCNAAYHLYRERFLSPRFGPHIIAVNDGPAEAFQPDYPALKPGDFPNSAAAFDSVQTQDISPLDPTC